MELNQSGGIVRAKRLMTKPEKVLEMNSDDQNGMGKAKTKPQFTPKNGSTVILAKRRLVKSMMLDWIVQSIASLLHSLCSSAFEAPRPYLKISAAAQSWCHFHYPIQQMARRKNNTLPYPSLHGNASIDYDGKLRN